MIEEKSRLPSLQVLPSFLTTTPSDAHLAPTSNSPALSQNQFCAWALKFPIEERYLALKLRLPSLVQSFRAHTRRYGDSWKFDTNDTAKTPSRLSKHVMAAYNSLIDSIVLVSEDVYLDTVAFEYSFVESPLKIYEMLASIRKIPAPHKNFQKQSLEPDTQLSKSHWIHLAAQQIQAQLVQKMLMQNPIANLEEEKANKKQFGNFWKNLPQEVKLDNLLLGNEDFKKLLLTLIDRGIQVRPHELQTQINDLMRLEKKELCNKIFKWRLKRTSYALCDYFELLFNRLKAALQKKPPSGRKKNGSRRKNRNANKRVKSVDACSNETNETEEEIRLEPIDYELAVSRKLDKDVLECVDKISEEANSYFDSRVLGFERLSYILSLCGISIKLYGSCACGIAVKNSDIDAAIGEQILSWFQYLPDTHYKIHSVFEMLENYFLAFKWIKNIKKIPTAYIPIMKFTIDTAVAFQLFGATEETNKYFNRPSSKQTLIQIDLTIETRLETTGLRHLGIVSTSQCIQWMDYIPTLRQIVILLKGKISEKGLNQTYYGGINTYTLIVMIVSFCLSTGLENETSIAKVLEAFLKFYGHEFDEQKEAIDLDSYLKGSSRVIFVKKDSKDCANLQVHDPLNDGKVMTRNCYRFGEIKQLFRDIYSGSFQKSKRKIEQIVSCWNIKMEPRSQQQLEGWIDDNLEVNDFDWLAA